jgi:hypothetical protein
MPPSRSVSLTDRAIPEPRHALLATHAPRIPAHAHLRNSRRKPKNHFETVRALLDNFPLVNPRIVMRVLAEASHGSEQHLTTPLDYRSIPVSLGEISNAPRRQHLHYTSSLELEPRCPGRADRSSQSPAARASLDTRPLTGSEKTRSIRGSVRLDEDDRLDAQDCVSEAERRPTGCLLSRRRRTPCCG